jgi:hypothetical protein
LAPIDPGSGETPTIATERGCNSRVSDVALSTVRPRDSGDPEFAFNAQAPSGFPLTRE